jgi:hypothetical protein
VVRTKPTRNGAERRRNSPRAGVLFARFARFP